MRYLCCTLFLFTFCGLASAAECDGINCSVEVENEDAQTFLTSADRASNSERSNAELERPDKPSISRDQNNETSPELIAPHTTEPGYSSQPFESSQSYGNRAFRDEGSVHRAKPGTASGQ